ncbi:MAG: hypothetical protein K8823_56 [Cenarchaeum symbiont of Oopsacas minuta]|nr:hypothetical protein [Cenarchaeum symbiont of Oopsacas minuta]
MKNAINMKKITTSLFLALTLVLGSVTFAVPGITPEASAATENLFVSADNKLFDKSFNGPMIIEVVVNDDDIDESGDLEPDVTINGANLDMVQAGDGNWYAYFAAADQVTNAIDARINYGTVAPPNIMTADGSPIYYNANEVIRQSKNIATGSTPGHLGEFDNWPAIQTFDFSVDGSVTLTYSKGGNPQSIELTYLDDPDDYASLSLDRDSYPPGADVLLTITSMSHNIDPTDEDSWTYNTANGTAYYQLFNENGDVSKILNTINTTISSTLNFDDSGLFIIDPDPNDELVLDFVGNNDQDISGAESVHQITINQPVTILETEPYSGIFLNYDDGDKANIKIWDNASRGYTGTIDYADSPLSVQVKNYPGSITMDIDGVGGTWNAGEEISVKLDDGDLNLNSRLDQDIELDNWNQKIPTVVIGNPLTLDDATIWYNNASLNANNIIECLKSDNSSLGGCIYTIDTFSKRVAISANFDNDTIVNNTEIFASFSIINETGLFYIENNAGGLVETPINFTTDVLDGIYNASLGNIISDIDGIVQPLITVTDIFSFGQTEDIDSAATSRHANAIYRMLLEETGDNTAIYSGTIEYTLLNQLNVHESDTYTGLETIDDEITIIVPTDLTDEDSVRVDYLDTDSESIETQIGDQAEAPTHSGTVSFDAANYKVADTVTVTLVDADLNTDSDTTEVYTTVQDTTNGDRVGKDSNGGKSEIGRLADITFDDRTWRYHGCGVDNDGLYSTGFILSETTSTSGIFTGTFQIPERYCLSNTTSSTTTGKDIEVNYVDYSEASGEYIEVGDSAGIRANTGSVSFDRTVYPVPFNTTEYLTHHTFANGTDQTLTDADSSLTGDAVLHIRVNDPDYDVSASGSDTLPAETISVKIIRGSVSSENLVPFLSEIEDIEEISPDSGIFELDLSLPATLDRAQAGNLIPASNADDAINHTTNIRQGDIVTVVYTDETDASGNENTVTDSATFDLRNAVLQTNEPVYIIGGNMILTLIEPDFDLDSDETETYPLNLIEWDSDAETLAMGESLNFDPEPSALRETGDSTGIFQVVIEIPSELGDEALERDEQIDLEYVDYGPAGADYVGADTEDIELTIRTSNYGATISLDQKIYSWTDKVFITINAPDHNFDSDLIDEIGDTPEDPIKVYTRESSINYYRLVETGTDTGIFTGEVILTGFQHNLGDGEMVDPVDTTDSSRNDPAGPTDGLLQSEDDDGVTVSFEVSEDDTIIGTALIRWNIGEINWIESSYPASGNGLVRVTDPDLNLNPESIDNFDVRVWSDSDSGGISLTVTETNEATGIFEGQVSFTTSDESSGHRLRVAEGDTVTAEYEEHTLPRPHDTTDTLDVTATAIIGSIVAPLERAPVSDARFVDSQGSPLSSASVDQQIQVSANIKSGQDKDQDYAYLVQIQDGNQVTVLLSWITGTLPAGSSSSSSQSWTPTEAGDYTATIFVWESINNPTALSPAIKATIQVS